MTKRPLQVRKLNVLTRITRKLVCHKLSTNLLFNWKRNQMHDLDFRRISPPNLNRNNVLSKAKQNYVDKSIEVDNKSTIESLIELKHTTQSGKAYVPNGKLLLLNCQ